MARRKVKIKMPKILIWDIETSPMIAATWSLWPKNGLPHGNIVRDWYIVTAAWKWADGKKIHSTAIDPEDARAYFYGETDIAPDEQVVRDLHAVISQADILVAHNGDNFDLKKFNARVIELGLPPLPSIRTVDTLKEIRKVAAFSSNRLDHLVKTLMGHGKISTNFDLWLNVIKGQKKALREMVRYCKRDVEILQQFYEYLRPYMKAHPNVTVGQVENGRIKACPKCGSTKCQRRGTQKTQTQVYDRWHCQSCGAWSRSSRVSGMGVLKPSAGRHT